MKISSYSKLQDTDAHTKKDKSKDMFDNLFKSSQ
jgi:hypothetical protein